MSTPRTFRNARILIVDDEPLIIEVLSEHFKASYDIETAMNGTDALAAVVRERPDLMLLDINMPRMNGIELLRKIRESEEYRDSIVFMLTTSNDEQDKIDAYDLNVAGYMLKTDMGTSFTRAISLIDNYWKVVEFPEHE